KRGRRVHPRAAHVRRAGAVVNDRRSRTSDRVAHRARVEQVDLYGTGDGSPYRTGSRPPYPRDDIAARFRQTVEQMASGESCRARDENRARHAGSWPGASARDAAQRAVERRKVAEASQRERQEEPVVGWNGDDRLQAAEAEGLVLERHAAALRVVEAGDALLQRRAVKQ